MKEGEICLIWQTSVQAMLAEGGLCGSFAEYVREHLMAIPDGVLEGICGDEHATPEISTKRLWDLLGSSSVAGEAFLSFALSRMYVRW